MIYKSRFKSFLVIYDFDLNNFSSAVIYDLDLNPFLGDFDLKLTNHITNRIAALHFFITAAITGISL